MQDTTKSKRMMPGDRPKRRARPEHTPAVHRSSRGRVRRWFTSFTPSVWCFRPYERLARPASGTARKAPPVPGRPALLTWELRREGRRDVPVTLAVLCTSTGIALDPADAARLAADLSTAMTAAGASRVERLASGMGQLSEIAKIAHGAQEPLLLCADNLVAHPSLLWMLATEPAGRSSALVVPDDNGDLREDRARVVRGRPGAPIRFAGALFVARADLPRLAETADRLSGGVRTPDGILATDVRSALDLLLFALLEAGPAPVATRARLLHAERVITPAQLAAARAAVAAVDEETARLRIAVKEKDDFFTTYAVSTWSPLVTRWCARLRLSPTAVTGLSVLFAVAAALCFWQASRLAMIAGAGLLYLAFVLDCVDGQLARF